MIIDLASEATPTVLTVLNSTASQATATFLPSVSNSEAVIVSESSHTDCSLSIAGPSSGEPSRETTRDGFESRLRDTGRNLIF